MLMKYILRRLLIAIPTLLVISLLVFWIIQIPEGNVVDQMRQRMLEGEGQIDEMQLRSIEEEYRIHDPFIIQYAHWIGNFIRGDLGKSAQDGRYVTEILGRLIPVTVAISIGALLISWGVAIPFGIIAAVKKNTAFDYALTFIGLTAMATPGFIIALIFQAYMVETFPGYSAIGLSSPAFADSSWWVQALDYLAHLFIPIFVLGVAGTAGMIRILRANVIDELKKQYVLCARARGVHPATVVLRYPVRVAINPFISNVGLILPGLISGSMIIAIVLQLPTLGPVNLTAVMNQDMKLAASTIFIQCILAVVGILLSDILLSLVDPRIKFEKK
jgi:peptide/nickel transport system permease protein